VTKIGFIGTGSMGGMMIRKLTGTGTVSSGDVIASNRSRDKLEAISGRTGIRAANDNCEVVRVSDVIFLCVKPLDVKGVLNEVGDLLTPGKLLVSIAGEVSFKYIAELSRARCVRVIPSITSEFSKGISLISFGDKTTPDDRDLVLLLFGSMGRPVVVDEKDLDVLTDLTSCAPAFISSMMQEFALAASRKHGISSELTRMLVMETLAGTSELLANGDNSFDYIIARVATKGGITEEGVKVIKKEAPLVYDHMLEATGAKRKLVEEKIRGQE
jgi:pyrroline-5-carboxylate reductase